MAKQRQLQIALAPLARISERSLDELRALSLPSIPWEDGQQQSVLVIAPCHLIATSTDDPAAQSTLDPGEWVLKVSLRRATQTTSVGERTRKVVSHYITFRILVS